MLVYLYICVVIAFNTIYKERKAEERGTEQRRVSERRGKRREERKGGMEGGRERFVREKIIYSLLNAA